MVNLSLEVRPNTPFPQGDAVITCMDGFDRITKVYTAAELSRTKKCDDLLRFNEMAAKIGLPMNVSKQVICSVNAAILGCELDGVAGLLRHRRDKTRNLFNRTLALLALQEVGQAAVQHWSGLFCFAAGFQRPLFSVLQDVFQFVSSYEDTHFQSLPTRERS